MIHGRGALTRPGRKARAVLAIGVTLGLFAAAGGFSNAQTEDASTASLSSVYRMNAGGPDFTDVLGQQWMGDTGARGGENTTTTETINGAWDQQLFQQQRKGFTSYVIEDFTGPHVLRLYFAATEAGLGSMSISAGSVTLIDSYDIEATVGLNTVDVAQRTVNLPEGGVELSFSGGTPTLAGIELLAVGESETDSERGSLVDVSTEAFTVSANQTAAPAASGTTAATPTASAAPTAGAAPTAPVEEDLPTSDRATDEELLGTTATGTSTGTTPTAATPATATEPAAPTTATPAATSPTGDTAVPSSDRATDDELLGRTPTEETEQSPPTSEVTTTAQPPSSTNGVEVQNGESTGTSAFRMLASETAATDDGGLTWRADTGTGGSLEALEDGLSARMGAESYVLPMLNGSYELEITFVGGDGTFSAVAEDSSIITDMDLAAMEPNFTMVGDITLTDGVLDLAFTGNANVASIELFMKDTAGTSTTGTSADGFPTDPVTSDAGAPGSDAPATDVPPTDAQSGDKGTATQSIDKASALLTTGDEPQLIDLNEAPQE
jgi:hypothetical protein